MVAEMYNSKVVLLSLKDVKARTALCRSSIYSNVAQGSFPKPVKLGSRKVCWLAHEIDQWIAGQIAKSRGMA